MLELLNVVWLAIATVSFAAVLRQRRGWRAVAAVACLAGLLFPIISASDDFLGDAQLLAKVLAAVLAMFVAAFGLRAAYVFAPVDARALRNDAHIRKEPRSPPVR